MAEYNAYPVTSGNTNPNITIHTRSDGSYYAHDAAGRNTCSYCNPKPAATHALTCPSCGAPVPAADDIPVIHPSAKYRLDGRD